MAEVDVVFVTSTEIRWVRDPHARPYVTPCRGCRGFCELVDSDDDGTTRECGGVEKVRQTTAWFVQVTASLADRWERRLLLEGKGQSEEEAWRDVHDRLADSLAELAANRLLWSEE